MLQFCQVPFSIESTELIQKWEGKYILFSHHNYNILYCTVHGFPNTNYDVIEGDKLDTYFHLNVKGETDFKNINIISGIITAVGGSGATSKLYIISFINVDSYDYCL